MPAFVELAEMDEFGIGPFRPTPRCGVNLVRKDADGNRDGHIFHIEKAEAVFPIEARRRNGRARQPIERDIIEDVVSGKTFGLSVEDTRDEFVTTYVVVENPCREADGRILNRVNSLRLVLHLDGVAQSVL